MKGKVSGSIPLLGTNRHNAYFISFQRLGQSLYKNLPIYRTGGAMVAHQPHKLETGFESHACIHKKAHTAIFFKKENQSNGRTQIFGDLQNRFKSGIIFLKVPCICLCSLSGLSAGLKNQRMRVRHLPQAPLRTTHRDPHYLLKK